MMKNKMIVLALGLFSCTLLVQAQESLEKWFKKCESINSIEMTVIQNRNPDTQKEESTTYQVSFKENPQLLKELIDAFNNEKGKAYRLAEKRSNGENRPDYCRFKDGKKETWFAFQFKGQQVTVTMRYLYDGINFGGMILHDFDPSQNYFMTEVPQLKRDAYKDYENRVKQYHEKGNTIKLNTDEWYSIARKALIQ